MVAVQFTAEELGVLAEVDTNDSRNSRDFYFNGKVRPAANKEVGVFDSLVKRAFSCLSEDTVVPLHNPDFTSCPVRFRRRQPSDEVHFFARKGKSIPKDLGLHADTNTEGLGATVYGAHLCIAGTSDNFGKLADKDSGTWSDQYTAGWPITHIGQSSPGTLQIHVRQAPAAASKLGIKPSAHCFVTTSQGLRVYLEGSYGQEKDW